MSVTVVHGRVISYDEESKKISKDSNVRKRAEAEESGKDERRVGERISAEESDEDETTKSLSEEGATGRSLATRREVKLM